jgi:hypothetical protein
VGSVRSASLLLLSPVVEVAAPVPSRASVEHQVLPSGARAPRNTLSCCAAASKDDASRQRQLS